MRRRADPATGLSALETAVGLCPAFDEPSKVLCQLQKAHVLIIQVLLLSGAEPSAAGADGQTAWSRAEKGGDAEAFRILSEWDSGTVDCEPFRL